MIFLKPALESDTDTVLRLHAEAAAWLAAKGTDQWQPDAAGQRTSDRVRESIARHIAEGVCWLAYSDTEVAGTITIDYFADPEFWTPDDNPEDAVYVHRMIVRREYAGRGIGKVLLLVADEVARRSNRHWVRLDAWSTNSALHGYYRSVGFEQVRILQYSHRGSGALFQRRVSESPVPADNSWRMARASN